MNPKTLVIADQLHPKFNELNSKFLVKSFDEALNSFDTYDIVFDLTPLRTQKKYMFLKELERTTKAEIISDLTLCWAEWIYKYCPYVKGSISTLFYSPTNSLEYSFNPNQKTSDNIIHSIEKYKNNLTMNGIEIKNHEFTFHYPRVISMIINEAYFGLEESLALKSDIDLAMKNGVNYPLGPIEWGDKIGLHLVAQLLDEMHTITNDDRYRLSTKLKLDSLKIF